MLALTAVVTIACNAHTQMLDCRFMHYAAAADRVPWLKCLLREGANIHEQDHAGNTPLHAAAHSGSPGAVLFLLQEKADLAKKNKRYVFTSS